VRAIARWWAAERIDGRAQRAEALAGLPGAIGSVPDGMAASVLAGVNPIHGLYASAVGPLVGGLLSSSRLMVVTTTSAAALAAGAAVQPLPRSDRPAALFLLTVLAGVLMAIAGVLRLGRITRFVSHSVMIGFLTGVAVNIVLGQLAELTGAPAEGDLVVERAYSVLTSPGDWQAATLVVSGLAAALLLGLARTRWAGVSAIAALAVPTALASVAGWGPVRRVSDLGRVPSGLPTPALPDLGTLSADVVAGAIAVAVIVLVQAAGVSESAPNPDGARSDANRDFLAQGMANVAAGLVRGQPVGGSVGQTALNVRAGARTRWAAVWSGLWMIVILVAIPGLVGQVAMATLAAVLVAAAVSSMRPGEVRAVLATGRDARAALLTTFGATLVLPIAAAVGIGVALSLVLQLHREQMDLRIVRLRLLEDGGIEEVEVPTSTPSRRVLVLDAYGSLLFAGARTLLVRLPDPSGSDRPVVVLRLRGRTTFGATFVVAIRDYAARLADVGGRLVLSGVDPSIVDQLTTRPSADLEELVDIVPASARLGESTRAAVEVGQRWLRD
jgi:sulfate permease, SulP family